MTGNGKSWDELTNELRGVVFKRGVQEVAQEIPAHRATVYRIIGGEVVRPSQAVRAGVERVVEGSNNE